MLPSELLMQRYQGEEVVPRRLPLQAASIAMAQELIDLFQSATGDSREALNTQLQVLEGEDTDYRVKRGLAHTLSASFCTFEVRSPLEPGDVAPARLRQIGPNRAQPAKQRQHPQPARRRAVSRTRARGVIRANPRRPLRRFARQPHPDPV